MTVAFTTRPSPLQDPTSTRLPEEDEEKRPDEEPPSLGFSVRASAEAGPFELRIVMPSDHYMVIPLNDAQKKQFNDHCEKLANGRSVTTIDITNLHLVFKDRDNSSKTDYLDSAEVKELRSLCTLVIDPKHKLRMNWKDIPEGGRGNMAKLTPFSHLSTGLKKRPMSETQFEKSINALSDPNKTKARKRRKIAHEFVHGIKEALQNLEETQKAADQLDTLYPFAIDFEIAHPIFETEDHADFSQRIDEKYQKALKLLQEKSLKDRALETIGKKEAVSSQELDLLAKKLALGGIRNRPAYEIQSKRLGVELEADSLEWAISVLTKAIHDDNGIAEALNLLPFTQFFGTLCPEDAATLSDFVKDELVPSLQR